MKNLIFAILIALLVACGCYWFVNIRQTEGGYKIDNVLLISMDTTRADILSCYGYKQKTTPNIDALANKAFLFENVVSPVPMTLPAHSSMLTGTIPPYHGVHDNIDYKLDSSHTTLAELLGKEGFTTAALISSFVLDSQFGLDQGFEYYNDEFTTLAGAGGHNERKADETTKFALDWLTKHKDQKSFMFLHYFDPHAPFDAPEPFDTMFTKQLPKNIDFMTFTKGLYAGEIAYTDKHIGMIINKLKELGTYDSTLIIIAGDHGEGLGEHEEAGHSYYIYNESIKVPLIFKLPGQKKPKRIKQTVGLVDIVPTIYSLLDIKTDAKSQGMDISTYFNKTNTTTPERYLYTESFTPTKYKANSLLAVITDRYKYIQTSRPELYDLVRDPLETNDIIKEQPQLARILQDRLAQILEESVSTDFDSKNQLGPDAVRKLESLGYVSASVTEDFSFDQTKDDPKDVFDYHIKEALVKMYLGESKPEKAKAVCFQLLRQRPNVHTPYLHLIDIAKANNNYSDALKYLLKAVQIEPNDYSLHDLLSEAYFKLGQTDRAIEHLEISLQIEPDRHQAQSLLGKLYYKQKNIDKSIDSYERSLTLEPDQPKVLLRLITAYQARGEAEKEIECLEKLMLLDPKDPKTMRQLAFAYYKQDNTEMAIKYWSDSLKIDPNHYRTLNALAWTKATCKDERYYDAQQAMVLAEKAIKATDADNYNALDTYAAALAANGNFDKAAKVAAKAVNLAISAGQKTTADEIEKHRDLYRSEQPYRK